MTGRTNGERALELASLWRALTVGNVTGLEYLQLVNRLLGEVEGRDGLVALVTEQAALTMRALDLQSALPDVVLSPDAVLQALAMAEVIP